MPAVCAAVRPTTQASAFSNEARCPFGGLVSIRATVPATKARLEQQSAGALDAARQAVEHAQAEVLRKEASLARVERDYLDAKITAEKWNRLEAKLTEQLSGAQSALERASSHVQEVQGHGPVGDAEEALLRYMAALKRAVADWVEKAPNWLRCVTRSGRCSNRSC